MKIAIIDADLIGRKKHRFPNLACMKLPGYWKNVCGEDVKLKTDYSDLYVYDRIYISKVFTDTPIDSDILTLPNVEYGGSGFFYDTAPPLPFGIEHQMPDYHLYDDWVQDLIDGGAKPSEIQYYQKYSIGFMTRGCFRGCKFCVNRNSKNTQLGSSLDEFLDPNRKKICLLDDNVLASPNWKEIFEELQATGKAFQFKQGLDERLLTDEKCEVIFRSKYDGDYIFAFDDITERDIIEEKLNLIHKYTTKRTKFYMLCAFDRSDKWDEEFWLQDIVDLMERIKILINHQSLPYIMRFACYEESPYRGLYISIASWCNQPNIFKRLSLREFAKACGERTAKCKNIMNFAAEFPWFEEYMDIKWPN